MFSTLTFLLLWIRVTCSQVIYDSPPVDVSLTRPILPWLARYYVGAGKSDILLDTPRTENTAAFDPVVKGVHQLHNTPMANYVPKLGVKRQEASDDDKPETEEKPAEGGGEKKGDEKKEEGPAPEAPKGDAPPAEENKAAVKAPKEGEPATAAASTAGEASPPKEEQPAASGQTEAPKEETKEPSKGSEPPASSTQQPFVAPPSIPALVPFTYYEGGGPPCGPPLLKGGVPAGPTPAQIFPPPYIYYPAPLPVHPSACPYPAPLVSQPTLVVSTTIQPPVLVTNTFPPIPPPKPIMLEVPNTWPPIPDPIPITPVTLSPATDIKPVATLPIATLPIASLPVPRPISPMPMSPMPMAMPMPAFPHFPLYSMPAHSVAPFNSVVPPGSYLGQPFISAPPVASLPIVSPRYHYRDINARPPGPRRNQVYLQTQPVYEISLRQ